MNKQIAKQHILYAIPFLLIGGIVFGWWLQERVEDMVTVRTSADTTTETASLPTTSNIERPESAVPLVPPAEIELQNELITLPEETLEKLELTGEEREQVYYTTAVPNDPQHASNWYHDRINSEAGWDISTGDPTSTIAVIDSGFALQHEDLMAAWDYNEGEQGNTQSGDTCWTGTPADKATNNCDDDGNGFIDDELGWDFSNDDNDPQAGEDDSDGSTHGSKTAGLVGARSDNGLGVSSVNWQTQLMPLQGLFDAGFGYSSDIAAAVVYAVDNGADVINMSLGGPSPDSTIRAAVRYASQNNVIVVASSGNCGAGQTGNCAGYPSPGGMGYPARYPETIAVGATTSSDAQASFSSWGDELDIVAPGSGSIRTTTWTTSNGTSAYATSSYGTSFSAPIVAGLVGLIKAEFPDATRDDALALLAGGAQKVAGMGGEDWTTRYGFGLIDVQATLQEIANLEAQRTKIDGTQDTQPATIAPLVSSNTGHTQATQISFSDEVTTYCITSPNTDCTLNIWRAGTVTIANLGTKTTNAQGIASWTWYRSDLWASGDWLAQTRANNISSTYENLYAQ